MTEKVNINGQEIELEQCVINGDELEIKEIVGLTDDCESYIYGDSIYYTPNSESLDNLTKLEVVEVPEDEQFIKEYIESSLDSQPNNPQEDILINDLMNQEYEVLPSYKKYEDWYPTSANGEDSLGAQEGYLLYLEKYRKELRDWWFKRKENKK